MCMKRQHDCCERAPSDRDCIDGREQPRRWSCRTTATCSNARHSRLGSTPLDWLRSAIPPAVQQFSCLRAYPFSAVDLAAYCASGARSLDKGCQYPASANDERTPQAPMPLSRRLKALVTMDPAVGPGFAEGALRALAIPTLVIGSVRNDFLPYASHAGRISTQIPGARAIGLDRGEGHFVYVDECTLPIEVIGVRLCTDAPGVDRSAVHEAMAKSIEQFLASAWSVG
jgi:pimeloyl-ACP methyl ester carboxylesterase